MKDSSNIENTDGAMMTLRYTTKKGHQKYRSLIYKAFRYVKVVFRNRNDFTLNSIILNESKYPVSKQNSFKSSFNTLNHIHDICKRTTHLCMMDTFVDCPSHEQNFWTGDFRNESIISQIHFNEPDIIKQSLYLGIKSIDRLPSSLVNYSGPEKKWPFIECLVPTDRYSTIKTWGFLFIWAYHQYIIKYTDIAFLKETYFEIKKVIDVCVQNIDHNGLFSLPLGTMLEWAYLDAQIDSYITHENAELKKTLELFSELSKEMGYYKEADFYINISKKLKDSINKNLWHKEKKAFSDSLSKDGVLSDSTTIQTTIMVYITNCFSDDRKNMVEKSILKTNNHNGKIQSPFMSFFYYEALSKIDDEPHLLDQIIKDYSIMINNNATTCYEMYPGFLKEKLTRSHCHGWAASGSYFLIREVFGIKEEKDKLVINPKIPLKYMDKLSKTNIVIPFNNDLLEIEVTLKENTFYYTIYNNEIDIDFRNNSYYKLNRVKEK